MPLLRPVSALFLILSLPFACQGGVAWPGARAFGQTPAASPASPALPAGGDRVRRNLYVSVVDKDTRFVEGLSAETFVVQDGKERAEVVSFAKADVPTSVGFLLDMSGSMFYQERKKIVVKERADVIRNAVTHFLEASHPANDYFVISFNQMHKELLDVTNDRAAVLAAVESIAANPLKGRTALYDTCRLALDKLARSTKARRVLVIFTDGQDNASRADFDDLKRALKQSDVLVYPLAFFSPHYDSFLHEEAQRILDEFAQISGGIAYTTRDMKEIEPMFAHVAQGLRMQYALEVGLAPSVRKDGWRELKVKLAEMRDKEGKTHKIFPRTRKGFYLPVAAR
ncbi:MAG TPA: VWA domain-containing protein [Pyrinomonadaceae bacterium]